MVFDSGMDNTIPFQAFIMLNASSSDNFLILIGRLDADRKMVEHWDALHELPDPAKAANTNGMF